MAKPTITAERLTELFNRDPRKDIEKAEALGVSKQTFSAWKNGSRSPKRSTLKKISEMYGVDELWFYGFDDETLASRSSRAEEMPVPTEEDEQIREIIELLSQLSDNKRAEALRYIRYLVASEEEG